MVTGPPCPASPPTPPVTTGVRSEEPASTVSPAIARFVDERTRDPLAPELPPATAAPGGAKLTESIAPVSLDGLSADTGGAEPGSTVSPAIARFLSQPRQNLPAAPPLELPGPESAGEVPVPSAVASPSGEVGGRPPAFPRAGAEPATGGADPLAYGLELKAAPLGPEDRPFPINLATALRLSDARPLMVAAAQAGIWVAEAELTRAKVLWVPTAVLGFDYIRHDGGGPDFNKGIITAPSVNYFMGGGAANLAVNVTDAYYEPLVARQVLNARQWDTQVAKNDAMWQVADAYFRVHQYRGIYAGMIYNVERGKDLVRRISSLSGDLVSKVEVDRARNFLTILELRAVSARQEWRVASADLTQMLRLDPRSVVEPMEHDHGQVTLIDPGRPLDDLMTVALANRPELASRQALLEAAAVRVQREKRRPFLPILRLDGFQHAQMHLQYGIFGIGPNSSLNQFRGRADTSFQVMWQLEAFGIGNLARIKAQRGMQSQAVVDLRNAQDMVAGDVTRAQARVQSAAARVLEADRSLRTGIKAFNGHLEGLGQTRRFGDVLVLTFRPQEAVYSLDLLRVAFTEYFTTVAEYNRAQFELFHALGYPAREVAALRNPGAIVPVDTSRPQYLPPVGHGPPPATR